MRSLLLLLFAASSAAQGVITTVAGADYVFPDDGQPATQARLVSPGGVVFDNGELYVADFGLNMILRIDAQGIIHIQAGNGLRASSGDGGPVRAASFNAPSDIAGSATDRYIAEFFGSRVRKVTAGVISTLVGFNGSGFSGDGGPASKAQIGAPSSIAVDRTGNLYIADPNNSRVRKVDLNGNISTFAGNGSSVTSGDGGQATNAGLAGPQRITLDPAGNLYIAQIDGRIRKVTPNGIISTFAQNLAGPLGMAFDASGNLLVCEQNFSHIVSIAPDGTRTVIAGNGTNGFADGPATTKAMFSRPVAIDTDPAGNIYVADLDNARIRKISNGIVTTIAGADAFTGDGGAASDARLNFPQGIIVDAPGNLYIADTQNNRVRKVTPSGAISTVAGNGHLGFSQDGTPAPSAFAFFPNAVAISPQGELVVGEGTRIFRIGLDGTHSTIAGTGFSGSSGDGGPATLATLNYVIAITYDAAGNLYLAEQTRVRRVSPSGTITAFAGNGQPGNSGDGGQATGANLTSIRGLVADPAGNIYISDNGAGVVRKVDMRGIITTVAGTGKPGNFQPGPGSATSIPLNSPSGLAADRNGLIYIVENGGLIIRRLDPKGTLSIYAGSQRNGTSGDGGPASAASFDQVDNIFCDSAGNLFVSDSRAGRVRVIQAAPSPLIALSEKGVTFSAVAGGAPPPETFTVFNSGQSTLNWSVSANTATGDDWLSVSPAFGASPAGGAGPPVQIIVNPAGLNPGDYYGRVAVRSIVALNSPQTITVVLSVRPAGSALGARVLPAGLVFTATANAPAAIASQPILVATLGAGTVSYRATVAGLQGVFNVSSSIGTISPGKPAIVQVLPSVAGLSPGAYNGSVTFTFSDNTTQTVQLVLVVTAGAAARPAAPGVHPAACAATRLLPVFTSIGTGFNVTTGWPSPVELRIVDDCGQPLTKGAVGVTFSNNDPALALASLGDGRWTGTWQAQSAASTVSITSSAQNSDNSLTGSAQITGGLSKNANPPPSVAAGGVLNAASYQLQAPLSPGSLIAIFGSLLAQGAVAAPALPLASSLGGTVVTLAGRPLPLLYAGPDQINAMIPYDLPINATHQLVVQRGAAISIPQPVNVLASQGGVFTKDLTGRGAGIVVKVASNGTQSVVGAENPVTAFDAIVIYSAGLGDVTPRQIAGQEVPVSPLSTTVESVKVTIGGIDAPVFFAGVTPGFTGLYQINAYVPSGVTPGSAVPLVITQSDRVGPAVTIPVR